MSSSKKHPTRSHHLFILDRSGSMTELWPEVIGSLNRSFETTKSIQQEHPDVEHLSYLIVFDNEVDLIFSGRPASYLRSLRGGEFPPRGMTALYDALGLGISRMQECVENGEDVLVTVLTDGFENSSSEYSARSIAPRIQQCREAGWRFVFLGASAEIVDQASDLGISGNDARSFDKGEGLSRTMFSYDLSRQAIARGEDRPDGFFED